MGGNYRHPDLPHLPQAERMSTETYLRVVSKVRSTLVISGVRKVNVPLAIREKADHGDVDVVIQASEIGVAKEAISRLTWIDPSTGASYLKALQHPESQDSFICQVEGVIVQVDLVKVPDEVYDFAVNYYSWNDAGNLIGRIARRRGMKFGWDGLQYVHRRGSRKLAKIQVIGDFKQALTYLGFDASKWDDGFDTYEDLFEWVRTSDHFEPSAYPLEHHNHRVRARDRKRKTYNMFLQWLNFTGEYVPAETEKHVEQMRKDFPEVDLLIKETEKLDDLRVKCKVLFGGSAVMEYFSDAGISIGGKQLGNLMIHVRQLLSTDEKTLTYDQETIHAAFDFAYRLYLEDLKNE